MRKGRGWVRESLVGPGDKSSDQSRGEDGWDL